jgi:DNA-binding response OmpR family regulator
MDDPMLFDNALRPVKINFRNVRHVHEICERRRVALIVEDDPRFREVMRGALVELGFDVLSARHYDAALAHLATAKPDLVCIDVGLPDKSGYELCETIRGPLGLHRLPIIVASEYGNAPDLAYAEDAGGNAFLRKPFSKEELSHCVTSLLERTASSAGPVHELELLGEIVLDLPSLAMPVVDSMVTLERRSRSCEIRD